MKGFWKLIDQSEKNFYKQFVDSTLQSLKQTDPDFAKALLKWRYLLDRTVYRLAKLSHKDCRDVFQDLLIQLVKTYQIYKSKTYRYNGNIYEVIGKNGNKWHLSSSRLNSKNKKDFWINRSQFKSVGKIPLTSSIFRKIQQEASTQACSVYAQKNGYSVVGKKSESGVKRNCKYKNNYEVIDKNVVQKNVEEVYLYDVDQYGRTYEEIISNNANRIEEEICLKDFFDKKRLSEEAKKLLDEWLRDYSVTDRDVCQALGFSKKKLALARMELKKVCNEYIGNASCYMTEKKPIQFRASFV